MLTGSTYFWNVLSEFAARFLNVAHVVWICSAFSKCCTCVVKVLKMLSEFAARFLNVANVLSKCWRCSLNLLLFCLFACVLSMCMCLKLQSHGATVVTGLIIINSLMKTFTTLPPPLWTPCLFFFSKHLSHLIYLSIYFLYLCIHFLWLLGVKRWTHEHLPLSERGLGVKWWSHEHLPLLEWGLWAGSFFWTRWRRLSPRTPKLAKPSFLLPLGLFGPIRLPT